jgi:hypothetical protein
MDRRLLIFSVAIAGIMIVTPVTITALPQDEPLRGRNQSANDSTIKQKSPSHEQQADSATVIRSPDRSVESSKETIELQRDIATYTRTLVVVGCVVGGLQLIILAFQVLYTGRYAKAAKESAEVTQRAFVGFHGFHVNPSIGEDGKVTYWKIIPRWHNFGPTPAMHATVISGLEIVDFKAREDFKLPKEPKECPETILAPRAKIDTNAVIIDLAAATDIQSKSIRMFIYSRFRYRDVFNNPHSTTACAEVLTAPDLLITPTPFRFQLTGMHNHAD